jgi:hypothetical protein
MSDENKTDRSDEKQSEKHEDGLQKETNGQPAPQNEPVDPLAFGCGFMSGEGI